MRGSTRDLLQLVNELGVLKYQKYVGQTVEILVEGPSKRNLTRMMGRTRGNKIVVFDGSERHRGQVMDVRVTQAELVYALRRLSHR